MWQRLKDPSVIGGGGALLLGFGVWVTEGGLSPSTPIPSWYWLGIVAMVVGAGLCIYGFFKPSRHTLGSTLADIKSDLVNMNAIERETALKKAKQPCDNETAVHIRKDFFALFDMNLTAFAQSLIGKVVMHHDIDSLIDFFKTTGDILDANDYGLKTDLEEHELYKQTRLSLAKKRVALRESQKKKAKIQKNIDRIRSLSYGLNSCILLRGIFHSAPELREELPAMVRVILEGIETKAETALNAMMNDLEGESKATIDWTQILAMFDKVEKMQPGNSLDQDGEMQNEHTNN